MPDSNHSAGAILPLKPYTQYRCATPGCGKTSTWTGALAARRRPSDGYCWSCRQPMTEVVDDGRRWRVSFEAVTGPAGFHPVTRETNDEAGARAQVTGLLELQAAGEPVRAVRLEVTKITWVEVEL